jgi:hypothetical protein
MHVTPWYGHLDLFPLRLTLSGIFAAISVVIYCLKKRTTGKELLEADLAPILCVCVYSGGIIESAYFLYCGLNPVRLAEMPEYPWLIVVASILIGCHAWIQLKKRFIEINPEAPKQ